MQYIQIQWLYLFIMYSLYDLINEQWSLVQWVLITLQLGCSKMKMCDMVGQPDRISTDGTAHSYYLILINLSGNIA